MEPRQKIQNRQKYSKKIVDLAEIFFKNPESQ